MWDSWCGQDMDQYIDYSTSILTGHGYSAHTVSTLYFVHPESNLYIPETMRLPAYPLLLTIARLFYNQPLILLVVNILCISIIITYSYKLYTHFFTNSWWIPFLLLLVNPTIIFYTTQMASVDIFTYAMVTGFTYHIIMLYKQKKVSIHTFFAFLFGLGAIFSRQNTLLYILPVSFLPLLESIYVYRKHMHKLLKNTFFLLLVGFIFFLALWVGRNFIITKSPTISTFSDLQLFNEYTYFSLFPNKQTKELVDWLYLDKTGEMYMSESIAKGMPIPVAFNQFNKIIHTKIMQYIFSHPNEIFLQFILSIKSFFLDTTFTWKSTTDILYRFKQVEVIINTILVSGVLISPFFYRKLKREGKIYVYMWIGLFLYVTVSAFFHGVVVGNRGILPLYTVFVLLSFYTLKDILILFYNILPVEKVRKTIFPNLRIKIH